MFEHGVPLWDHGPLVSTGREFVTLLATYRETFFILLFSPS